MQTYHWKLLVTFLAMSLVALALGLLSAMLR